ncbi:VOC family protein [Methylobacterium thuringiense]|uniref:VOC domain-containing protein n=1 Tax=Methylobacterium thuringiense TaxID=1003091 RepID=A0ABQ4TTG3_9HYPH|nr:VOC family protein [Methylobacterium thuringiense]GJE56915.1 hypothetical protein EKPJFOCH_3425 [Methylobacterium thuringiense]
MRLDHVTLRVRDLDAHRRFFKAVLDLRDGFRPAFGFPGCWLYAGSEPVVHLIPARPGGAEAAPSGEGIDHVAFLRDDHDAFCERLDHHGIPYGRMELPEIGERRLFIHAPGGALIEVAFREPTPTPRTQEALP